MLKKFLAFLGLMSVTLEDGKATVELTEEQMEASGKIIDERDNAVATVIKLSAELEEEKQQNTSAQSALAQANEKIKAFETEISALKAENEELKLEPGAKKLETTQATDGNSKKDPIIDPDASFEENYAKSIDLFY